LFVVCCLLMAGCSSSTVETSERPLATYIRRGTQETREFREMPAGEEEMWLQALWCPKCKEWQPMPPGDAWQRNAALRVCPKTRTPLVLKP
ncbi:MAG: hypothetical protein C0478_04165, partial [Planctomyces sp.]|nr:hypothetical protein [Planctomyces sp.]